MSKLNSAAERPRGGFRIEYRRAVLTVPYMQGLSQIHSRPGQISHSIARKAVLAAAILALALVAQAPVPAPAAFDVASIPPQTGPSSIEYQLTISGTLVSMEGYNIRWLVEEAYDLKSYQLSFASLPHRDDIDDVFYNIVARAPGEGVLTQDRFREMLKTLLAARFKLAIHRETKDLPVYALVLDQKGLKLKENKTAEKCETLGSPEPNGQKFEATACSMSVLVGQLANYINDRPVVDKTGLIGAYDFTFTATPQYRNPRPDDISPFTAIRELGLKLEKQQAPIEMVVVDHVEKHT